MIFELLPVLFALDGADSDVTCYIFGGIWPLYCIGLNKKIKITTYGPIKNLSPLLKGKGCHWKKNKKFTSITHNIVEAHPHWYVVAVYVLQSIRTGS
jgi:hypothetical protein